MGTGQLIRAYLLAKGIGYPYAVWRFMERILTAPRVRLGGVFVANKHYQLPSYLSTVRMFQNLRTLGVVEEAPIGEAIRQDGQAAITTRTRGQKKRKYFRIVRGKADDVAWRDSYEARYNPRYFAYARQVPRSQMSEGDLETVRVFIMENRL